MSDTVIKVEGLGKRYFTGMGSGSGDLRESITNAVAGMVRRLGGQRADAEQTNPTFWALKDISFEIERGDVFGIIGRNGAGKSTLLKILARVTAPTCGRAWVEGRVGSLLEVGTGFHPELSGRENTYLNATILGMSTAQIDEKYDDIVRYAGIRAFMETPVKRYSSGMRVRLAFAIAAHMNPEVLILDEVLTVGDVEFRRKSSETIFEYAQSDNTILFVSHNLESVRGLCNRTLYLDHGEARFIGDTDTAIDMYLSDMKQKDSDNLLEARRGPKLTPVIRAIRFLDEGGKQIVAAESGSDVMVEITLEHDAELNKPYVDVFIQDTRGAKLAWVASDIQAPLPGSIPGESRIRVKLRELPLLPGAYMFSVEIGSDGKRLDRVNRAGELQLFKADVYGTGRLQDNDRGPVVIHADYEVDGS